MNKGILTVALGLILAFPAVAWAADEDWQTKSIPADLESSIVCIPDGCYKILANCDSKAGDDLRLLIRQKLFKEGLNKEQTVAYLTQTYGEQVLAAPPKKGFDWIAWITPFAATVGGAAVVYLGLDKWALAARKKEKEDVREQLGSDDLAMLNHELKKYL